MKMVSATSKMGVNMKAEYKAKISQHCTNILEYGYIDDDPYNDKEKVERWAKQFYDQGHTVFTYSEESSFAMCDICNLHADCVDVTITIFEG
jgi:hypothetical protein